MSHLILSPIVHLALLFYLEGLNWAGGVGVHFSVVGKPQLIRKMYVNLESRLRRQRDSESATRFVFRDRP